VYRGGCLAVQRLFAEQNRPIDLSYRPSVCDRQWEVRITNNNNNNNNRGSMGMGEVVPL